MKDENLKKKVIKQPQHITAFKRVLVSDPETASLSKEREHTDPGIQIIISESEKLLFCRIKVIREI